MHVPKSDAAGQQVPASQAYLDTICSTRAEFATKGEVIQLHCTDTHTVGI